MNFHELSYCKPFVTLHTKPWKGVTIPAQGEDRAKRHP